jgi:cytoskeletal protein RodZ
MPKSGFIGVFLLIVTGLLAGISFLIAFGKIPTNFGRSNPSRESVREEFPPSTLPTVQKTSPTPSTTEKQNPSSQTQTDSSSDSTQEDTSSTDQNTPTPTPTPTSSSNSPDKGKPPSDDDNGNVFVGG